MSAIHAARVGAAPAPVSASSRGRFGVVATILVAPILVMAALRLPVINQLDYADAWFYSAYGWVPKHHFQFFGFNYFAVRFPAIVSIGVFEKAFGAQGGYLILRYVLAIASGGSLYLLVRRFATAPVALAAALLLYLNPFFSRMLLWDYSYFIVVSLGLTGIALWWWAEGRHWGWTVLAGAAMAAAAFAQTTFVTLAFVLVVIEVVAAARTGRAGLLRAVIVRLALCLAGSVAVYAAGYLAYLAALGSVGPYDLLRPTIKFLGDNKHQIEPYVQPTRLWLLHEPRIWAPVVLSVALMAVLRRRVLGSTLEARVAQLCIGFTAFVWLYRFTVTSSFIEVWWSYHITVVVMAPAIGVLLHALATEHPRGNRWAAGAIVAAAATALIIRDVPWAVGGLYHGLNAHSGVLLAGLAVALLAALATGLRRSGLAFAALVAVLVCEGVMTYAPDVLDGRGGTGIFVEHGARDWAGYAAGHDFVQFVRDHDHPDDRVFLWYPTATGYPDIGWADLPQYGQTVQVLGVPASMATLTPFGIARLKLPHVGTVLVMSTRSLDLDAARAALTAGGFRIRDEARGRFAGRVPYVLVRLLSKPA